MTAKPPPPRLGRGLAALLGDAATPSAPLPAQMIRALPVESLEPGPFQPRKSMEPEALAELVDSIRHQGLLQPILVRPCPGRSGQYQIIAGERRWRASQKAGLHEVPVLLRDLSDSDAMAASLVENLQRQDLNPIEEAEGYRRLLDEFGLTQEQMAQAVGKSRSAVANALRLLQLPESVRHDLQRGVLTVGHARALLAHPDPAAAARMVIARGLNVRQTEAVAKVPEPNLNAAPASDPTSTYHPDPDTAAVARDLSESLGLKVEISFNGKGGQVRIAYRSLDQLDGIIALLNGRS